MKPVWILSVAGAMFCLHSCQCKDNKLDKIRTDYTGPEIRLDGVWIGREDGDTSDIAVARVFYRNGVMLNIGNLSTDSIESSLQEYIENDLVDARADMLNWRVFSVQGHSLITRGLSPRQYGLCPKVAGHEARINSDTVFTEEWYRPDNRTVTATYRFRPVRVKPDSTNPHVR